MLKISTKCMYFLQVSIIAFMLSACSSLKITDEIVPSDGVQGITISKKSKAISPRRLNKSSRIN